MDASLLKSRYSLEIADLPNPTGMNVVTIDRVDTVYYHAFEEGRKVEKCKHVLYLREFTLPLRLNNTRVDILTALYGSDTNGWHGHKIGLVVIAENHYGKTKPSLAIHIQSQDGQPACVPQGRYASPHARLSPGASHPPAALPAAAPAPVFDVAPIGAKNAAAFKAALAEQGTTFDKFLEWLKRDQHEVYGRCFGVEIERIPRGAAPWMQRYLREYMAVDVLPAPPPPPPPPPLEVAFGPGGHKQPLGPSPVTEDDIPF